MHRFQKFGLNADFVFIFKIAPASVIERIPANEKRIISDFQRFSPKMLGYVYAELQMNGLK